MKSRNGFVSNSSTSSFIIPNDTVKDIALSMADTITESAYDYMISENEKGTSNLLVTLYAKKNFVHKKECRSRLKKFLELEKSKIESGQIGIMMQSCNFDTWIARKDNSIYVSTCNNYEWNISGNFNVEWNDESRELITKVHHNGIFFYNLDSGNYHTVPIRSYGYELLSDDSKKMIGYSVDLSPPKNQICPSENICHKTKMYDYVVDINGNKLCGWCYEGVLEECKKADILEIF